MPYYTGPFGIQVDFSGSGYTTSSAINFVYQSGSYLNPLSSGSIGAIKTRTVDATKEGVRGDVFIELSNQDYKNFTEVARFSISGSNNTPQFGIGFPADEELLSQFDVKSVSDNKDGTEIILRSGRPEGTAVQTGDLAGNIIFTIDSGSYRTAGKEQFIQSASIASIDTVVTEASPGGAQGHLRIKTSRSNREAGRALWTMGYAADPRTGGNFGSITSGSLNIVGLNSASPLGGQITLTHNKEDKGFIQLHYFTSSVSSDTVSILNSFVTGSYSGLMYDYTLVKPGGGARAGQIMATWYGGNVEMTDISTPSLGPSKPPSITAELQGNDDDIFVLRITNGGGYSFKAFRKTF